MILLNLDGELIQILGIDSDPLTFMHTLGLLLAALLALSMALINCVHFDDPLGSPVTICD